MQPDEEFKTFKDISEADTLTDTYVSSYWAAVSRMLIVVFQQNELAAAVSIQTLRSKLDDEGGQNSRLLFYHLNPLQVAADLGGAGDRSLSEDEKQRYFELRNEDRDDPLDLKAVQHSFPEDLGFH